MQQFLKTGTVNTNIMSLTGYRTLIIYFSLLESPKTIDEINDILFNDKYIREKFSADTIRNYINSLRSAGCEITKATKSNDNKFTLVKNPCEFKISEEQLSALNEIFQSFKETTNLRDRENFEAFIIRLRDYVKDSYTKNCLQKFLVLEGIEKPLYFELRRHCELNSALKIVYNSPARGIEELEMTCDKMVVKSKRLYLSGYNKNYGEYSSLLVKRIKNISPIIIKNESPNVKNKMRVICEIYDKNYIPQKDETVIKHDDDKVTVEILNPDKFVVIQRILFAGDKCRIIEPDFLKDRLIATLQEMRSIYG